MGGKLKPHSNGNKASEEKKLRKLDKTNVYIVPQETAFLLGRGPTTVPWSVAARAVRAGEAVRSPMITIELFLVLPWCLAS